MRRTTKADAANDIKSLESKTGNIKTTAMNFIVSNSHDLQYRDALLAALTNDDISRASIIELVAHMLEMDYQKWEKIQSLELKTQAYAEITKAIASLASADGLKGAIRNVEYRREQQERDDIEETQRDAQWYDVT